MAAAGGAAGGMMAGAADLAGVFGSERNRLALRRMMQLENAHPWWQLVRAAVAY